MPFPVPVVGETASTCPYCGVGCGVLIEHSDGRITGVRGDPAHPANFGKLCSKGQTLHLTASEAVNRSTRLLQPLHRATRGGPTQPIGWEPAMDLAADRLAAIVRESGPDALGFYISGQLLTEDYYVFNKLAKGLLGTNNVDTNSRLCMSSAVAGYKATLGADAPPACYEDLDHADVVFITGANPAWAHPVLFRRLEEAKRARPQQKWVVVDPRRTDTAAVADLHLAIAPGTDVALCHGLLHLMLWEGWVDEAYIAAHTTGFDALKRRVREFTPKDTARLCGIAEADLLQAAQWWGTSGAVLSLYCQGLNQSARGTDKNAALINLHLATGQIGRAGAGPFSLTGQPNAMGGREVGGLANLLSAHRDLANPAHRAEVAALWGVADVPAKPGKSAVDMFEAAADGEIRALWIACTNPAHSLPDQATVRRALQRAEFVVLQEAYATTATAPYADLLLPATTWGEKGGTVTNSERRISRVRAAVAPPGAARADWAIAADLGRRLEARLGTQRLDGGSLFNFHTAEAVWNEHRETTRGRDLDITALSYPTLDALGPQQWPWAEGAAQPTARLYADGIFPTPDGRARFADMAYTAVAEPCDARFPIALTTGRLRDQWHGMSRTGTLGRLFGHVAEATIDLHPTDLARRRLADGQLVRVRSRRGSLVLPVRASTEVGLARAFIAMHWGEEVLSGADAEGRAIEGVNALTNPARCASSQQPELKHTAVRVEAAGLPWTLLAMALMPQAQALARREALKPLMHEFGYASCLPFGREPHAQGLSGVLWRCAAATAPAADVMQRLQTLFDLDAPGAVRYADPARGQCRVIRMEAEPSGARRLRGFLMTGDTTAEAWLSRLLRDEEPTSAAASQLLRPGARPDAPLAPRDAQVCTCYDVRASHIRVALAACAPAMGTEARLQHLQDRLRCGTGCGSCRPTLRAMVADAGQ